MNIRSALKKKRKENNRKNRKPHIKTCALLLAAILSLRRSKGGS